MRFKTLAYTCIFAGILMRTFALDHIPGLNGDEAWYGILAKSILAGDPTNFRTPNGGFCGPLHLILILISQFVLGNVFGINNAVVLRLPSLIGGLLTLFFFYRLSVQTVSKKVALATTSLLTVFPMPLLYSRFGWEVSQTPLGVVLLLHSLQSKNRWAIFASVLLCVSIHPINIFILPLVWTMVVADTHFNGSLTRRQKYLNYLGLTTFSIALVGGLARILNIPAQASIPLQIDRLWDFPEFFTFLTRATQLFSGFASLEYITGSYASSLSIFFWMWSSLLLVGSLIWLIYRSITRKDHVTLSFIIGLFASLILFYLKMGAYSIVPHQERYGYFLIIPLFWSLVTALKDLSSERFAALTGSLCLISIILVTHDYLFAFQQEDTHRHFAFRTSSIEPKQQAYERLLAESMKSSEGKIHVFFENFWIGEPLTYYAYKKNIELEPIELYKKRSHGFVVYDANGPVKASVPRVLKDFDIKKTEISEYSGRSLIEIVEFKEKNNAPFK